MSRYELLSLPEFKAVFTGGSSSDSDFKIKLNFKTEYLLVYICNHHIYIFNMHLYIYFV